MSVCSFICFFMLSCFSWISDPASPPFRSSNRICQVAQISWLPISQLFSNGLKHYGANWNTTWHEAGVCPLSKMQWVTRWCQLLLKLQWHYFIPVGEWSVAMSISVCVFVSPRVYLRNHVSKVTKFSVCIACSHGLTLHWRHCDRLCTSVLVDEVTISYGSYGAMKLQQQLCGSIVNGITPVLRVCMVFVAFCLRPLPGEVCDASLPCQIWNFILL